MKHKFLKCFFVFLSLFVILVTFSLTAFAKDPPMFSTGVSSDPNYIYSGNTDIMLSLDLYDSDSGDSFDLSTTLNPSISSDMVSGEATDYFDQNYVNADGFDSPLVSGYYDSFRASDHYFDFGIVRDDSFFSSNFNINYQVGSINYRIDAVNVSARDFYIYLDPNDDVSVSFDDYFAESYLLLDSRSYYDYNSSTGTIYYCLAGDEDSDPLVYNYSLPSDSGSYSQFYTLPLDQSFSGTYSEPTLIYVEYFSLTIPINDPFGENYISSGFSFSGTFMNYNMDYRSIDILSSSSSNVDPITPINPGVFRDYTGWLGTAVGGFLDLQIVDGFTLGGILMVIIAFMITMWFLKVFAGG